MKRKRRQKTVITTETHQLTIIHPLGRGVRTWCERCASESEFVTPEAAARLLGVTAREVYRRVESGSLHFMEVEGGKLLICCGQVSAR